jgi:hypothetical protein
MRGHVFVRVKRFPWAVCSACGLIALKNDASRSAASKECRGTFREHVFVARDVA